MVKKTRPTFQDSIPARLLLEKKVIALKTEGFMLFLEVLSMFCLLITLECHKLDYNRLSKWLQLLDSIIVSSYTIAKFLGALAQHSLWCLFTTFLWRIMGFPDSFLYTMMLNISLEAFIDLSICNTHMVGFFFYPNSSILTKISLDFQG